MQMSDLALEDLFGLFAKPVPLAEGQFRIVYEMQTIHKGRVLKREKTHEQIEFHNVAESALWREFRGTPLELWLAPCEWISPGGGWLIQHRTTPIHTDDLPRRVPSIFSDLKPHNFGWYKGRIVCHDYGQHRAYRLAAQEGRKLREAKWTPNQ